jgi:hypothetical protein
MVVVMAVLLVEPTLVLKVVLAQQWVVVMAPAPVMVEVEVVMTLVQPLKPPLKV